MTWDKIAELKETIVSMINYKDMVLVATSSNIYVIKDGKINLMEFEIEEIKR